MKAPKSRKPNPESATGQLVLRAAEAQKQAELARKRARQVKAQYKEARRAFKKAKKAAKQARKIAKAASKVLRTRPVVPRARAPKKIQPERRPERKVRDAKPLVSITPSAGTTSSNTMQAPEPNPPADLSTAEGVQGRKTVSE